MFKVGDFVALNRKPFSDFIVTRIYDNDFMAVGTYDVLDGMIFNEYKLKQKYFKLIDANLSIVEGLTYKQFLNNLIEEYFVKDENNNLKLLFTKDSRDGISPTYGLPLNEFGFTTLE